MLISFGGNIFDDWRLPTSLNQDGSGPVAGDNQNGSEMGHLYFIELENKDEPHGLVNTGAFQNLLVDTIYWTSTEAGSLDAWLFDTFNGDQLGFSTPTQKIFTHYALAVRDGDVAATEPIPEPATVALLGIGLAGLAGAEVRRRRKNKAVDDSQVNI